MYPVSVIDCPGTERGLFCISIIDLVLRSALIFFSLLRASNYHYNKEPLKLGFFKCKTIHSRLSRISILHSISLWWVIKTVFIYIIVRYTCGGTFTAIFHLPAILLLFLLCFILNCHETLFFSLISNLFFCGIFKHNFFAAVKVIHKLLFQSITTISDTKLLLPKPKLSA